MSKIYEEIAKNIRFFRKRKGMTQKDLAAAIGVVPSAVCNWENGCTIDIDTLCNICIVLGKDLSDMYGLYGLEHTSQYTEKEQNLVTSYRNHPDMQAAVDKLLDLSADLERS